MPAVRRERARGITLRGMTTARLGPQRLSAIAVVLLLSILAVGLALRLSGLDQRTLTHAEVYVPRIEMPDYVTAPPPRPTLTATVLGTLHHDNTIRRDTTR
jgi:hypothetical protein